MNSYTFDPNHVAKATARTLFCAAVVAAVGLTGCHTTATDTAVHTEAGGRLVSVGTSSGIELDSTGRHLAGIATKAAGMEDVSPSVQPTGEVAATDTGTIQVTARLPGRITDARVSVGTRIHRGQIVASVDSTDLTTAEAAYQTAISHARLAFNQLAQQRKLAGYGTISEQPIEDARKALSGAKAAVSSDEAQISLDKLTLANTKQLVAMGEITRKPVEDAQNAYAQAQSSLAQAKVSLHSTKSNLDRATILYNGGVFSRQQLEDAETAYNNAVASSAQATTQEKLAAEELKRQESIFAQNLNGASSLQQAQSKLLQDQHTYNNDLIAEELARKQFSRAQVVHRSGIPVSQALQQAQDTYDAAEVAVQGAANTLRLYGVSPSAGAAQLTNGHAVIPIVSPIDGIVTSRNMVTGQIVDITTPLLKVVNLDQVYVDAQVYEKDIAGIRMGDPIKLQVSAFPGHVFSGKVSYVANDVSPDTRTLTVRTVVNNPGWLLRPGMFATVLIGSRRGTRALAVPADAILQEGVRQVVYVEVAPNRYVKRTVTVGPVVNGRAPVRSGLAAGDMVVVAGAVLLEQEQDKLESEQRRTR